MKKSLLLFYLMFLFSLLSAQKHNVVIEGQLLGYDGSGTIGYTISPVAGARPYTLLEPDSAGRFIISTHIKETEYFKVCWTGKAASHWVELVVRPNNRYSFVSEEDERDKDKAWARISFPDIYSLQTGNQDGTKLFKLDKGQMLYNMIDNEIHGTLFNVNWNLQQPHTLLDSLNHKINRELSPFKKLLNQGDIDPEFYEISKLNIEYKYAERLASTIRSAFWAPKYIIKDTIIQRQLLEVYPEIFKRYPVEASTIRHLDNMVFYTDMYLEFLEDYQDGIYTYKRRKGNSAFKAIYDKSVNILPNDVNQHYQRYHTLCNAASLGTITKAHLQKYLQDHPELKGTYDGGLIEDLLLPRVEEYEKLQSEKLPEECIVVHSDSINSFEELFDYLGAKPLLVDCWGSWCAPCRAQFQFMSEVKEKLKERGITMVYLAYEYNDDTQLRESIIKSYKLEGYHIVANKNLKADLQRIQGDGLKFPTFMILDKDGQIVCKDAPLANDIDRLIAELDKYIN